MSRRSIIGAAAAAFLAAGTPGPAAAAETTMTNPLLPQWTGPYGGVPPFDKVKVEQFKPALEASMAEAIAELEAIANDPAPPTFANTIAAMEKSGRAFDRVQNIYGVYSSTMSTDDFQAVEREMAPKLAAFSDKVVQNEKLFKRIAAVYDARETAGLTPEQKRLAWLIHNNFVRAGAKLDAAGKKRIGEINQRLATLYTSFSQNVLADEKDHMLVLEKESDLAGLPESVRASAAAAAESRGQKGKWAILNTRSSVEPFLAYSDRRDLREKVWRTFVSRGDNADAKDNNKIISEILRLRAERAKLLGYRTHAHWRLENSMAKTPERAMELLEAVWTPAAARVREEVADMQAVADKEGAKIKIEPWDYRYYAEKVRKARYDLDENEVKPYLQLEKLREGMFWMAGEIFGFHFTPVADVSVYHPDVRVWEVKDAAGQHVGLWYFDPYARPGKQSGAWMNAYRTQEKFERPVTTIVSNNSNFVKGKPGEPVLISWTDAQTLFHEFGHALHGLSSNVNYPSLAGTAVARDYVEFPSQLLEHWLSTPEVLNRFALHYRTGEPIPPALVAKIKRADTFNEGFKTLEYLASAIVDLKLHTSTETDIDPDKFERETLAALGMPSEIVMRHRTPHFGHIFAGDGYSAGYYSYLWSDTITADAYEAFTEAGGPYDKAIAKKLRENVFAIGNTVDPADAYRAFRGRDPGIDALMRKRGFPAPKGSTSTPAGDKTGRAFEYRSKSEEARRLLFDLQARIENFQFGPENVERAKKIVALDPGFAMGQYYLSAVTPGPDGEKEYRKALEMAKGAADGDRRFIEAVYHARVNQGNDFKKALPELEAVARDYPGERLVHVILGQLYNGDGQGARAREMFERARVIGPRSARVEAFLAQGDLLKEDYGKARATYLDVEKSLPKGAVPFAVRFGITFSHLYEGNVDAALESLRTYLAEYRAGGLGQQFPEVFIWNAMARINLESGRLADAMRAYEKGYESIPGSNLDEVQKKTWLGRLHHGKARTLARMGKHQEAWAEVETIKKMIEDGGEEGKQFWPAYHYVAGYAKLEAGDAAAALEHLKQADPNDPFHALLRARAYERVGQKAEAKAEYRKVVDSQWAGIERPLAYPEAKKKLAVL
jgi:peptidyl-dipeptidase Dcp